MLKKIAVAIPLSILLLAAVWVFATGSAEDPLVSLSYLTDTFTKLVDKKVDERLDESDKKILESIESGGGVTQIAATWEEIRLKRDDMLLGSTGTGVLLLAGNGQVAYASGAVIDVTTGTVLESGGAMQVNHRYMVAEDTSAVFMITSKTAVLDYQGEYAFSYSGSTDYNAMAAALKHLNLFKGSFTGYGQGFDLELAPTRLQALIMFIRVLGEEEQALAWTGTTPFKDIHPGTQAYQYVGYAYEKGYTNGYTTTEFRPAGAVNAYQYTEFVLRAMGYSSAANTNLADTLERAQVAGLLTEGEVALLKVEQFLRAELVYISYYALETVLPDGGQTLGDLLQIKGVFTAEDWWTTRKLVPNQRL